jgi:hypothetical protein
LLYQVPIGCKHTWFEGVSNRFEITPASTNVYTRLGVGTSNTNTLYSAEIQGTVNLNKVRNSNNKLLVLWDNASNDALLGASNFYGFGVNASSLRYQVPAGSNHIWFEGSSNRFEVTPASTNVYNRLGVGTCNTNSLYTAEIQGTLCINKANIWPMNKLLVLFDNGSNDAVATACNFFGFGINSNMLRYQVPASQKHCFYINNAETLSITSTGIGVGVSNPNPLFSAEFFGTLRVNRSNSINNKLLVLWDSDASSNDALLGASNFLGFGINANVLRYQVPASDNHVFYVGNSNKFQISPSITYSYNKRLQIFTGSSGGSELYLTDVPGFDWLIGTASRLYFQMNPNSGGGYGTTVVLELHPNFCYIRAPVTANSYGTWSDDRLKTEEIFITDALPTILKLRPQIYNKHSCLPSDEKYGTQHDLVFRESGLIAQEVYYTVPEIRHLVNVPDDADVNALNLIPVPNSSDPQIDPVEYLEYWGTKPASVNYTGLIPYLIQSIKELSQLVDEQKAIIVSQGEQIAALTARLDAL